ncbi:MAG: hypothetical protein COV45_04300 [Deltaproteobacteria bacterium CG11_big_fil_rev_8_21_14_0_20_47_16]|nr:MAG: hypothetical protein COV45_04300 [Deltaproteobacteria bacterium CG11_big_fil_rev_8_21_14_0_20_47_16]
MFTPTVSELIPILQTAIGPAILISGIGLLLLTMTNRLGRAIDRSRILISEMIKASPNDRHKYQKQLTVIWKRARLIRLSIALSATSALAAALLIATLFSVAIFKLELTWLIGSLFTVGIICLIVSLVVFIQDINQSLAALKHEISHHEL